MEEQAVTRELSKCDEILTRKLKDIEKSSIKAYQDSLKREIKR